MSYPVKGVSLGSLRHSPALPRCIHGEPFPRWSPLFCLVTAPLFRRARHLSRSWTSRLAATTVARDILRLCSGPPCAACAPPHQAGASGTAGLSARDSRPCPVPATLTLAAVLDRNLGPRLGSMLQAAAALSSKECRTPHADRSVYPLPRSPATPR